MAHRIDGKQIAEQLRSEIKSSVHEWTKVGRPIPTLAAILVGDDPASQVYVRNKEAACEKVGIQSRLFRLAAATNESELLELIDQLNQDPSVNGILVQLPLPNAIDAQRILDSVTPLKDVDAFHPENVGLISQGRPRFLPCTPHGIQQIFAREKIEVSGKHVVVVGRSDIVGKPIASMLAQKDCPLGAAYANGTVTLCHSRSREISKMTGQADILIAAIGKPNFITADMVKPDSVVIDVGINRVDSGLVGDVDFASVSPIVQAITPVPGGVGPMTIAMLLFNTLLACRLQQKGK
jgi:methylenetetrahydrofolate dehydrogenase (NADP+) / methenyltetrahydrofolate cyclohydrolase